ncbi:hypothetical protein P8452_34687 [Trifolium repens]|nr:hypothetical protein P8452_34687 [Trifolium repens]
MYQPNRESSTPTGLILKTVHLRRLPKASCNPFSLSVILICFWKESDIGDEIILSESSTPNLLGHSSPSGVTNLRRSARLMLSANPATKKMAEASNNQRPSKRAKKSEKSEENQYFSCRNPQNIGRMGVRVRFDPKTLAPHNAHVLDGCATLAMQDYAIQKSQNWRDWCLLKIVDAYRVSVSGFRHYITFDAKNGHGVRHTFEADVWDSVRYGRRINGFRTLKPRSKWYSGNLWIPLTRSTFYSQPNPTDSINAGAASDPNLQRSEKEETLLSPPERMGEDSRNTYNDGRAKKSDEILSLGSDLVNLELDKLSDNDIGILKDCATLAMQDHLIQTLNGEWRDWELIKIVTAYKSHSVSGYIYSLNFEIGYDDSARTLEAEVSDGKDQRRVINLRAIKPRITEWYPGNLWIPI